MYALHPTLNPPKPSLLYCYSFHVRSSQRNRKKTECEWWPEVPGSYLSGAWSVVGVLLLLLLLRARTLAE